MLPASGWGPHRSFPPWLERPLLNHTVPQPHNPVSEQQMTGEPTVLHDIPGGRALFDWFGRVPRFHDAELLEITLASNGPSTLRIHTWEMTDEVDAQGYFVLDKHVVVTVTLDQVTHVSLTDFNLPGIIADLKITRVEEAYQFTWEGSYGVEGALRAKQVSFDLQAGKP